MSFPLGEEDIPLSQYEEERAARIALNMSRLESLGVLSQASSLSAALEQAKKAARPPRAPRRPPSASTAAPSRTSERLAARPPKWMGIDVATCPHGRPPRGGGTSRLPVRRAPAGPLGPEWAAAVAARRCDSIARGSVYDGTVGLTCHFCRQKKLCGEPACRRCAVGDPSKPCAGKSECWRCGGPTGRFCRACLDVRYGLSLESVKAQNAAADAAWAEARKAHEGRPGALPASSLPRGWLCPHCHEGEQHGADGWVCNSSICLSRRGVKPTGIAVFEARRLGFASVAHWLAGQWAAAVKKGGSAVLPVTVPAPAAEEARLAGSVPAVPGPRPPSARPRPSGGRAGPAAAGGGARRPASGKPRSRPPSAKAPPRPPTAKKAGKRPASGKAVGRPATAGGGAKSRRASARAPPAQPPPPPPPSQTRAKVAASAPAPRAVTARGRLVRACRPLSAAA